MIGLEGLPDFGSLFGLEFFRPSQGSKRRQSFPSAVNLDSEGVK